MLGRFRGAPTWRILSLGILSERIRAERILAERIRAERILVTKYPPTVSILSQTYPIVNVSSVLMYPHRTYPPTDRILSLNKSVVWCSTPILYNNYYRNHSKDSWAQEIMREESLDVGVQADRRKSRTKAREHKRCDLKKWCENFKDMPLKDYLYGCVDIDKQL